MPDTWITKLEHYLNEDGEFPADLGGPAQSLARFFAEIVSATTEARRSAVRCRRRPNRKPCPGVIQAVVEVRREEILWECPVCGDNGVLSGWAGTKWDRRLEDTR